jgi:hypothetical protein
MPPLCLPLMSNPVIGFLRSIFGGGRNDRPSEAEMQSVSFYISDDYRYARLQGENPDYGPVRELEAACFAAIAAAGTGPGGRQLDPGGFSPGYGGEFEFSGPDARALFDSIKDIIMNSEITRGGEATLHFGYEDFSQHEDIPLGPR